MAAAVFTVGAAFEMMQTEPTQQVCPFCCMSIDATVSIMTMNTATFLMSKLYVDRCIKHAAPL